MYGQKMIIYPDGKDRSGIRTDIFDLSAFFVSFFVTLNLIKLVFEETSAPLGIGICFCYLAFLAFTFFYIFSKQKKFPLKAIFPLALCIVSALSIGIHNYTLSAIIPYLFYLSGLFCMSLTETKGADNKSYIDLYLQVKSILFIPVSKIFTPFISVFKNIGVIKNKKYLGAAVGFICGVPVFIVVSNLLIDSDEAFGNLMTGLAEKLSELFSFGDDYLTSIFFIPTLIFAPYIMSTIFAFRHGITQEKMNRDNTNENVKNLRFVSSSVLCGFYGIVALCYIVYLFSQLSYLFGAFSGDVPMGTSISISDYARRGFFEMSAVAFINLLLIGLGAVCAKREKGDRLSKYYKIFSIFFCLFTMLLIITAMSKMVLYISSMGLTPKRIVVSLCDIVLFIAFLSVLIKLLGVKFPYMKVIMYTLLVVTTAYFAVSAECVIASYNTNAYLSGKHKEIDLSYIMYDCSYNNDYFAVINLDKIAVAKDDARAKAYVYKTYRFQSKAPNSFNDWLLSRYVLKNEERIKGYRKDYENENFSLNKYPSQYGDITEDVIFVSFETEKDAETVTFKNEYMNCTYYEYETEFEAGMFELYWDYPSDTNVLADITVTDKEGKTYNCKMIKAENSVSRYYTLKDDGKGGFVCVQQ